MGDDITVSREYFLALLRRAEHVEKAQLKSTVLVTCAEYSELQQAHAEYEALKYALVKAGTPIESIRLLINATIGTSVPVEKKADLLESEVQSIGSSATRCWSRAPLLPPGLMKRKNWTPEDSGPTTPTTVEEEPDDEKDVQVHHSNTDCHRDRSVVIKGITKHTTLRDVCKAIRGGAILNIYRKDHDQTFHVAFVEPLEAENFIHYTKKNGLYIKNKRVEVLWDEKQHFMTAGLGQSIKRSGATRNLVVRFPNPGVTAEIIRDDLEHIHLLEVVSLRFEDGHAWISLNGIQHAMTAKNCLRSRFRYRGSSIQYWPDECVGPWKVVTKPVVRSWKPNHQAKASAVSLNRFNGLMEYNDDETSSESSSDA